MSGRHSPPGSRHRARDPQRFFKLRDGDFAVSLRGDRSACLGEKSVVTEHYAGQAGCELGYYEYTMKPEFDDEFSQYKFSHDGGDGMQWQIPVELIPRSNELITGQRWVNYYQ